MTSAQSWIVENISSLISSNHDDDNDCTLTLPNETTTQKPKNLSPLIPCDLEVELSRTVVDDGFQGERIPKRPFSPENIAENNRQNEQMNIFYNNTLFTQNNQELMNSFVDLRPLDIVEINNLKPSKAFPTSSSFYDDLNLDSCSKNDKFLSNFISSQNNNNMIYLNQLTTDSSSHDFFDMNLTNNDSFNNVKKKKLTNYSLSSSNLPSMTLSSAIYNNENNNHINNSVYEEDNLSRNLSNSSYSITSSGISASSSCNSNLSSYSQSNNNNNHNSNYNTSGFFSKEDSENLLMNWGEFNSNNTDNGLLGQVNTDSSYFEMMKSDAFKKLAKLQQQQDGRDMFSQSYFEHSRTNSHNQHNQTQWNQMQHQQNQQNQSSKFPKKITKSSTTVFNQENSMNYQKPAHFFPQSTSYDNMSSLNNMKSLKPLVNEFIGYSSNDFLLSGDNSFNDKSSFYSNANHANKNLQHHSMNHNVSVITNGSSNSSMLNNSCANGSNSGKDISVLHVRNLDYKISADEWKRILLENFRKHCKEIISVNVFTNADKSLLGVVKLATKEDGRLAISCLHHKKIGYKRLNVAFAATNNSPKSKIVALLKTSEQKEMPLTRFISLYEAKYNQSIAINELFNLKEIVQIFHKDGQGRQIKLIGRNVQANLDSEEESVRHSPFCSLHSQKTEMNYQMSLSNASSLSSETGTGSGPVLGWLPNVIVSLRTFKSAVHKLLNDHGGQMPLLSFMDCYKCCIFNENSSNNNTHRGLNNSNMSNNTTSNSMSNGSNDLSYQLVIDNENGVSLEHLITCAQDVQIQYNQGFFKQLQWENDKSKPINLQSRSSASAVAAIKSRNHSNLDSQQIGENYDLDDSIEDSQRKLNQFSHEVVELFKEKPRCIIQMSNFTTEYHKKYGRQLRLADYDSNLYQNLKELLEAIPHILQILDSQYDKKLTLTHRVQVRRFSNDLIKVLKSHPTKQMFADEYPISYEKHFGRKFEIRDYGVCYLEDMLAELPESIICRKEIEGRTFIQIPKIVQMDEERLCTNRLTYDIIDMLKHKSRFSIQFNKFIPHFHHHFGRQCKLSNYGFTKLIELLEAMPDTVHVINKDGHQFVQLKENIMLDLICSNIVKYLEENNLKLKLSLIKLEEIYNSRYETIHYQDFKCENFIQLFKILPLKKHFINAYPSSKPETNDCEWFVQSECFNEKELKRSAKIMLRKLIDEHEEKVLFLIKESKLANHKPFRLSDLCEILSSGSTDNGIHTNCNIYNNRSMHFLHKLLGDYLVFDEKDESVIIGLSDLYVFGKQIRNLFRFSKLPSNDMTLTIPEVEFLYNQAYVVNNIKSGNNGAIAKSETGCLPFKRLGFIDVSLLFSQGISLIVTVKKYAEKRIYLNREFWSKSLDASNHNISNDSFNSPLSPINNRNQPGITATINNSNRTPFNNITPLTNNSGGTPISDRMSSSFSSTSLNFSRRSVFNHNSNGMSASNGVSNIANENNNINNFYYKNFEN